MVSGPEALRRLDRSMRDIRDEEISLTRSSADASAKIARLREVESEQFLALAKLRLDPKRRAEVTDYISRAEKDANEMLQRHGSKLDELSGLLADVDKDIEATRDKRDAAMADYEAAQKKLDQLSADVFADLDKDANYQAQKQAVDDAVATFNHADEKAGVAEKDREEKGAPYRNDPLFMYLFERGYGTNAYKASNITRLLDGWVARMVRYHDAKPNFVILNEIPMRLREHAEHLQDDIETERQKLDALEDAAFDAHGGKEARELADRSEEIISAIDARLVELEDQRDELVHRQRKFSEGQNPAFREAVDMLASGLQREGLEDLYAAARQTATREDDQIVRKIDAVRSEIVTLETEINATKDRLKLLAERRRELEDIEWEFKQKRYDRPSFDFDDDLVEDLLEDFLKGAVSAASYWGKWQQAQKYKGPKRRRSKDQYSNPWGASSYSGRKRRKSKDHGVFGSSSSDFSRPRSTPRGSKGKRDHGGFKTGGKF
ncbi:hypothetical protein [Maritalea mediterranea]|uniref:Uncharacterized protein n=1 Tax=Maritalea mediterranea TaxID=2909667 RepID=A0ABS9E5F7_9HYPH|nr:hypothetical protein [Maritalea mediterranea]MCF4097447.1 hypothetical protein [Maritalea mediterranea]